MHFPINESSPVVKLHRMLEYIVNVEEDRPIHIEDAENGMKNVYQLSDDHLFRIWEVIVDDDISGQGLFIERYGIDTLRLRGYLKDNKLHGTLTHYRERSGRDNTKFCSTEFVNDEVEGNSYRFFEDGKTIESHEIYASGKLLANIEYDWNNKPDAILQKYHGMRHGLCLVEIKDGHRFYNLYNRGNCVRLDIVGMSGRANLVDLTEEEILFLELRSKLPCQQIIALQKSYLS